MSCGHCQMKMTRGLEKIPGVQTISIDLEQKLVVVETDLSREEIYKAISEIGYHPR
jgi:copper chaperone CopZ